MINVWGDSIGAGVSSYMCRKQIRKMQEADSRKDEETEKNLVEDPASSCEKEHNGTATVLENYALHNTAGNGYINYTYVPDYTHVTKM